MKAINSQKLFHHMKMISFHFNGLLN